MNAPITASQLQEQTSIANRAMKFRLSRGGTHRRVRDKDAEALVEQNSGEGGWIVSRQLFQDKNSLVYKYQQVANEMYLYHVKSTLPFGDDASRLLPNAMYFEYTSTMQNYISRLDQMKATIVSTWDAIVAADIAMRNAVKAANGKAQDATTDDYPTAAQMANRLYINWYPEAISTSNDFRFELPPDMVQRVDQQLSDMVDAAGRDLYMRMLEPVTAFVKKLTVYTGEKGQRFSSSFIDNLNELTSSLPKLNVNNDPEVGRLLDEINQIVKPYVFSPDTLRESQTARDSVKAKLAALETQLKGYTLCANCAGYR